MNTILPPIESEFGTPQAVQVEAQVEAQAEARAEVQAHDAWFRSRVLESMADTRPAVPHEQVVAESEAILEAAEKNQSVRQR